MTETQMTPRTAPPALPENIIHNGAMTVELRTANCGLSQSAGGVGRFDVAGRTEPWKLPYEEVLYVLTGVVRLGFADGEIEARPGDVVTIPRGSEVTYGGDAGTSAFFALTPSDWAEEHPNGL